MSTDLHGKYGCAGFCQQHPSEHLDADGVCAACETETEAPERMRSQLQRCADAIAEFDGERGRLWDGGGK